MKKLSLIVLVLLGFTISHSFAAKQTVDIKEVKLHYCNGTGSSTKSLLLSTQPNQEEEICMEFTNEGSVSANIGINFVDGTLTADGDQKRACLPEAEKYQFGQYVTGYESTINIPPRGMVRTYAKIKFPSGYAGASYGCVTYFLPDATKDTVQQDGKMFEIFARVGSFVDVFVDGKILPDVITISAESDLYKDIGSNPNVMIYRDGRRKYNIKSVVFNTGNIAVSGDITLGRSTWGGLLKYNTTLTGQKILPQQFKTIDGFLPWYVTRLIGGPTTVSVSVDYTPIYLGAFNTVKNDESYSLIDTNSHFYFPWILLLLLLLLFKRRRKKYQRSEDTLDQSDSQQGSLTMKPKRVVRKNIDQKLESSTKNISSKRRISKKSE